MKKSFPDLNKDGKVTKADVLKGRGVPGFKKGTYMCSPRKMEAGAMEMPRMKCGGMHKKRYGGTYKK
jgi:hypothetical protein